MGEGRILAKWEVVGEELGIQLERVGVAPCLFASPVSYSYGSWQTIIGGTKFLQGLATDFLKEGSLVDHLNKLRGNECDLN